jgi:hypothetical protein
MARPGETFPMAGKVWSRVAEALRPPPLLPLSEWIEQAIRLPQGLAAEPGPIRLWPYEKALADAFVDGLTMPPCAIQFAPETRVLTSGG